MSSVRAIREHGDMVRPQNRVEVHCACGVLPVGNTSSVHAVVAAYSLAFHVLVDVNTLIAYLQV